MKEPILELYFKTKSYIFIVRTHFYGDIVFIIEKKTALLTLKRYGVLHALFNKSYTLLVMKKIIFPKKPLASFISKWSKQKEFGN